MSTIEKFDICNLHILQPISLEALNQKAAMLTRLDNKYIVREQVLMHALPQLSRFFDVLEINGQRSFTYETCYFDDEKLSCYYSHHQGRRLRVKVRTRKYCDANLCFVEAKLKDTRGVTIKKRYPYRTESHGILDEDALDYVKKVQWDLYSKGLVEKFTPTLEMSYERITLVAKDGGERLTLDRKMRFFKDGKEHSTADDIFIVETKSRNANGIADAIFRSHHQHPVSKCSKYCLGMCITQQVKKFNNFMPALRRLGMRMNDGVIHAY
jgi:VTC domain